MKTDTGRCGVNYITLHSLCGQQSLIRYGKRPVLSEFLLEAHFSTFGGSWLTGIKIN